jgi:hypothetical protein
VNRDLADGSGSARGGRWRSAAWRFLAATLLLGGNAWLATSVFEPVPRAASVAVLSPDPVPYVWVSNSFVRAASATIGSFLILIAFHFFLVVRRTPRGEEPFSRRRTAYLLPLWWTLASLLPLATLVLPDRARLPSIAYVLFDLRFFWWPVVLLDALRRVDPPLTGPAGAFARSRALRVLALTTVPLACAVAFTPHLRFTGVLHGDEPKYLRYCESFFQGTGFDVSKKRLLTEMPEPRRSHVLGNVTLFIRTIPEEARLLTGDLGRLIGLSHQPRLLAQPPTPAMFFVGKQPGTFYQLHNPGVSFLLFPAYYLDRRFTGAGVDEKGEFQESMPALSVALLAWYLAYGGALYALLRDHTGAPALACGLALAGTLAMPAGAFAFQIYPEIAAGVLIFMLVRWLLSAEGERSHPVVDLLHGAAAGFLPWLHIRLSVVSLLAIAWALLFSRHRARAIRFSATALLGLASIGLYTYHLTGSLLPSSTYGSEPPLSVSRMVRGLPGMMFDGTWGLFPHAPMFLLALLGAGATWRRRPHTLVLVSLTVAAVAVPAAGHGYWAGGSTPGRYLVSVAPLLLLPVADALRGRDRRWTVGLLAATIVISIETVIRYNLDHLKHHGPLITHGFAGWRPNLLFPMMGTETWTGTAADVVLLASWIGVAGAALVWSFRRESAVDGPARGHGLVPRMFGALAGIAATAVVVALGSGRVRAAEYLPSHRDARERVLSAVAAEPRCAICYASGVGAVDPTTLFNNGLGLVDVRVRPDAPRAGDSHALRVRPRTVEGERLLATIRIDFGDGTTTTLRRHFGDVDVPHSYAAGDYTARVWASSGSSPMETTIPVHVAARD